MKYLGGKSRIADKLVEVIQPFVDKSNGYIEPFVGGANVIMRIKHNVKIACDANKALITLWQAVQDGWIPPISLSEEEYKVLKDKKDPDDPMTAFAAFGCSFGAKWFAGYARSSKGVSDSSQYALSCHKSLLQKIKTLQSNDTVFIHTDYRKMKYPKGFVVYSDPPYAGTTSYAGVDKFNHEEFWEFQRQLNKKGCKVFISEYNAPIDFKIALEIPTSLALLVKEGDSNKRLEKLFTL